LVPNLREKTLIVVLPLALVAPQKFLLSLVSFLYILNALDFEGKRKHEI
jgi:hypothetical protein